LPLQSDGGNESKIIRVVAFTLNLLLLFTTGVFIVQRGTMWEEAPIILLMTAAPHVSLFALLELSGGACSGRSPEADLKVGLYVQK